MSFVMRTASRDKDQIALAREALDTKFKEYKTLGDLQADPKFQRDVAVLIRQLARDQFALVDPTPLLFDRKAGPGLGNRLEITEFVNTAKVVKRSLGGKPKTFTPSKKKYPVTLSDYRIDFAFELESILTGQMDASVWVDFMAESISRHFVDMSLSAIDTACAAGVLDAYGNAVRTTVATAIDTAALDAALKRLGDVNENVVIAGRYSTLFPMLGFTGYSDVALEQIRTQGAIGSYKGAQVVVLRDSYNPFFGTPSIPADRVYFAGASKGGTLYEDDMSSLDYQTIDPEEQHFRVGTKLRAEANVFKAWKYHVLEIT